MENQCERCKGVGCIKTSRMMCCAICLNDAEQKKQCESCYRIGQILQTIWAQCMVCCGSGSGSKTQTTGKDAAERIPH